MLFHKNLTVPKKSNGGPFGLAKTVLLPWKSKITAGETLWYKKIFRKKYHRAKKVQTQPMKVETRAKKVFSKQKLNKPRATVKIMK